MAPAPRKGLTYKVCEVASLERYKSTWRIKPQESFIRIGKLVPSYPPTMHLPARRVPRKAPAGDSGSSPCPLYFYCPERCNQRTGVNGKTCGSMGVPLFSSLSRFLVSGEITRVLLSKNASKSTFLSYDLLLSKTL